MLQLKIQTHKSIETIEVDPSTRVGVFLLSFVQNLGYPPKDRKGTLLPYHLQLASTGKRNLPYGMSFAELQIPPSSVLVLNVPETKNTTIPINRKVQETNVNTWSKVWLNRRTFLLGSIYSTVAGSGLLLGATMGIVQRVASASQSQTPKTHQSNTTSSFPTEAVKKLTFTQHTAAVRTVSWSRDGLTLASGSDDATILLWTPDGIVHQQLQHQAPVLSTAWSPDGQRLVAGSGNEVTFWQASTGTIQTRSSSPHVAPITSLAWATQGQMQVVSGAQDTRAAVWSTKNANYKVQIIFTHHTSPIESVSFASDGQSVASSSRGGFTRVWSCVDGLELHGFYQPSLRPARTLCFSPVDPHLAIGCDDGHIRLWESGLQCNQQNLEGFGLQCIVIPQDLQVHTKPIRAVAWSPSGKLLASGGDDGLLAVWAPSQSSSPLFTVQLPDVLYSLAWGPNDQQIVTASGNTTIVWALQ